MSTIKTDDFFKSKRNTSEIKSEILNKYFKAWAGIMLYGQSFKRINELIYIDLYAGQGYYEDGSKSTPVKILDSIINTDGTSIDFNKSVKVFFNDEKKKVIENLEKNVKSLEYYDRLIHKPVFLNQPANQQLLIELLNKNNNKSPTLTFIDPFGYKGLSKTMLLHSVKQWGSDLFMLFNINRIKGAIKNKIVEHLMRDIFDQDLSEIQEYYDNNKSPKLREDFIIQRFEALFRNKGYLTFRFKINFPNQRRTSHYLIFVTKHELGYLKIKEIIKNYTEYQEDGVPLLGVNLKYEPLMFNLYSIGNLKEELILKAQFYNNKTIEEIYKIHNLGTNYIKDNFKTAVFELFTEEKIKLFDPKGKEVLKDGRITYTQSVKFK